MPPGPWPRRWTARWVGLPDPERGLRALDPDAPLAPYAALFRRDVVLARVPPSAPCRVTADGRYRLQVNGAPVGRGPVRSDPTYLQWDSYDLTPHLVPGTNTVTVLLRHEGAASRTFLPAPRIGDLGQVGLLLEADLDGTLLVTDASWIGRRTAHRWSAADRWHDVPGAESYDARAVPEPWLPAEVLQADRTGAHPFGLLAANELPPLAGRLVGLTEAARSAPGDASWVTYDAGRVLCGTPVVTLDADEGTELDLVAGEDVGAAGHPVAAPRHWSYRYLCSGSPGETAEPLDPVGFRWLQVSVRAGRVRSLTVEVRESGWQRPEGPSFDSDDAVLTALWATGGATLDACATDAIVDCPGREQRAWVGDASVTTLVALVCNADTRLVVRHLHLLGQGMRPDGLRPMVAGGDHAARPVTIPDFSLHWVRAVAAAYGHLGDLTIVERAWGRVWDALAWAEWHRGADGLLADLGGWVFVDWAQTGRGRSMAAVDALYGLALADAAALADALGDQGTAARLRARAARTVAALEAYWDEARGVYVDAVGDDGRRGRRVSQQTNALVLLWGAPRERWDRMLDRVLDPARLLMTRHPGDGAPPHEALGFQWSAPRAAGGGATMDTEEQVVLAQPFFAHFLHQALARAGRRADLLSSLRRWVGVAAGNGVFGEYWEQVAGYGSRCHAWSATPTYDLTTHVLGVRRAAVGWREVEVDPYFGPLSRLRGSVPTPLGAVEVTFERATGGAVTLPQGMTGRVRWAGEWQPLVPGRTDVGPGP